MERWELKGTENVVQVTAAASIANGNTEGGLDTLSKAKTEAEVASDDATLAAIRANADAREAQARDPSGWKGDRVGWQSASTEAGGHKGGDGKSDPKPPPDPPNDPIDPKPPPDPPSDPIDPKPPPDPPSDFLPFLGLFSARVWACHINDRCRDATAIKATSYYPHFPFLERDITRDLHSHARSAQHRGPRRGA